MVYRNDKDSNNIKNGDFRFHNTLYTKKYYNKNREVKNIVLTNDRGRWEIKDCQIFTVEKYVSVRLWR